MHENFSLEALLECFRDEDIDHALREGLETSGSRAEKDGRLLDLDESLEQQYGTPTSILGAFTTVALEQACIVVGVPAMGDRGVVIGRLEQLIGGEGKAQPADLLGESRRQAEQRDVADTQTGEDIERAEQERVAYVIEQLNAGFPKVTIADGLLRMGLDRREAAELVDGIHSAVVEAVEAERLSPAGMARALAGGAGAAIIGGVIWGLIVIATNYEVGFMAIGLGLLAGYGVLIVSGGKRGIPFQVVAILSSVLGIVIAKYFVYVHFLREAVVEAFGQAVGSAVSFFSGDVIDSFMTDFTDVFSGYDILWMALAVYAAWKIPSGTGLRLPGVARR